MSDPIQPPPQGHRKMPVPVIIVAIMNFISVSCLATLSFLSLIVLIFGNVMGIYDIVSRQINHFAPTPNYTYGLTFIFGVLLASCLSFVLFFVLLGAGLLKGNKVAWYVQIALSVFGLFGFPFWTILNAVILFLFFRQPVRDFFKV